MQSSIYVALSGQIALEKRLDSIANNIANLGTVGFRADGIKFESLISQTASDSVAFASAGAHYISRRSGAFMKTGNLLDVAVRGEGWMAFQTPDGSVYSRDGRLQMTDTGDLLSVGGLPVLDVGGAPILLNPDAGQGSQARFPGWAPCAGNKAQALRPRSAGRLLLPVFA